MALTADRELGRFIDQLIRAFKLGGGEHVFKGGFLAADASGYCAPLAAGEAFLGIAFESVDNSSGGAGDLTVRCYTAGDFRVPLAGATIADVGAAVYASDDATATLTATANSFIGRVVDVPTGGEIILRIAPFQTAP